MTDTTTAPLDPVVGEVMRVLDMAVIEWVADESYRPLASVPHWFTGTVSWMSLPFLEHFVDEARRFLHDHLGGVLASDQFTVQSGSDELLLRARALKVNGRLVLAIERLEGASDIRPILREARQQALDQEALADRARAVHTPIEAVARAIGNLQRTQLTDDQRPLVDALTRALAQLQDAAAPLPPRRKRRQRAT